MDELNFIFRRFNSNHIRLVVSPDAVVAITSRGELRARATISYGRQGDREIILGIGDDPIHDVDATRVELFSPAALNSPDYSALLDKFLTVTLKRSPRSGSMFRPVILLEGLDSLPDAVRARVREELIRALANAGAAAVVVGPVVN